MMTIKNLDRFLIDSTQRAYLWLLDWTGMYVGSLVFVLIVASNFVTEVPVVGMVVSIVIVIPFCGYRYYLQGTNVDAFNVIVEINTRHWTRACLILFVTSHGVLSIVKTDVGGIMHGSIWIVVCYLLTVKVRKREPKEFFERKGATNEC